MIYESERHEYSEEEQVPEAPASLGEQAIKASITPDDTEVDEPVTELSEEEQLRLRLTREWAEKEAERRRVKQQLRAAEGIQKPKPIRRHTDEPVPITKKDTVNRTFSFCEASEEVST